MKKWLSIGLTLLCCSILDHTEAYGETNVDEKVLSAEDVQKTAEKQVTKEFEARGDVEKERQRQQRSFRYSSLEASGLYAEQGNVLTVHVNGQDSLTLMIGTPERNTQKRYPLTQGMNIINVENEGAVYVINPNDSGSALVSISGATGSMPYFDLNTTSVEAFQKQMTEETTAKDVQLVSNKAIITVSYEQAKKQLKDPKELMDYFDTFLLAQDRVSGIDDNGKPENHTDRHFQHFVEVSKMYMFSTHEYMGFNGDGALARLLKTNNGWGVWHESGHQRQQAPWKWGSVTESTVNIYSMAAQKETAGSTTALDQYYPQMYAFLQSENKNFEKQNNDLKMVFFGQLGNTFGENFYPILHQYYRENVRAYASDAERIQHFILNVSTITGYNMIPYFEQWGFAIDSATREKVTGLLPLPEQIWLNDNKMNKKLPMRMIDSVSLSKKEVSVSLTNYGMDVFQGQKLVLLKNNKMISELTNKQPTASTLNNNKWTTSLSIKPSDDIRIETRNADGTFQLYRNTIAATQLKDQLTGYLNSSDDISMSLSQNMLDDFRKKITKESDNIDGKEQLLTLLNNVEQRYLDELVKDIRLSDDGSLSVEFSNAKFKEYKKIMVVGTDKTIAEITKGKATYSTLTANTLTVPNQGNQESFAIQFRLSHNTYTVGTIRKEVLLLKNQVNGLFIGNKLNPDITQEKIDQLRTQVTQLEGNLKDEWMQKVNAAQQAFLEALIAEMTVTNGKLTVTFSNEGFKKYKIVVLENGKYIAEVTNGTAYYGQLRDLVFNMNRTATSGKTYELEVRHASGNYKVQKIVGS